MTLHVKKDNVQKSVTGLYVKQDNVVKPVLSGWIKKDNVVQQFWPSSGPIIIPDISKGDQTTQSESAFIQVELQFNPGYLVAGEGDYYVYAYNLLSYSDGLWHSNAPITGSDFVYRWRNEVISDIGPGSGSATNSAPQAKDIWGPMNGIFTFYTVDAAPSGGAYDYFWNFDIDIAMNNGAGGPLGGEGGILKTISVSLSLTVVDA